jgi:NAD(P)H-dependent FMN reductase
MSERDMHTLKVVIASTRPGRGGLPVGNWAVERARAHGGFNVEVIDLAEVNLPFLDEPKHPRLQQYEHEHTKNWSKTISAADAFVFVVPEYDYGMPATLLNALHYLTHEWSYKACGFVSYGGISGGTRSVQMSKMVITSLRMMPVPEACSIPFYTKQLDGGVFKGDKGQEDATKLMLDEVLKWTTAIKVLRT